MMQLYITTAGRPTRQCTWRHLPKVLQERTRLVVQAREASQYPGYPLVVLPSEIQNLSVTRQWVVEHHDLKSGWKVVLLDDDLRFDKRRTDDPSKFLVATMQDVEEMFGAVEGALNTYAHVGVAAREGGHSDQFQQGDLECVRMVRILAYDIRVLRKHRVRFDRLPLQSDFDVTLQLLRLGYKNLLLTQWVHGQHESNASGGCSVYRTPELLEQNSRRLAKLHTPFVTVVTRETKGAWGGGGRVDVKINWKQAYHLRNQRTLL